jgi:hypothetical protein
MLTAVETVVIGHLVFESEPHENVTGQEHFSFSIVHAVGDIHSTCAANSNKQNVIRANNINGFRARFYTE